MRYTCLLTRTSLERGGGGVSLRTRPSSAPFALERPRPAVLFDYLCHFTPLSHWRGAVCARCEYLPDAPVHYQSIMSPRSRKISLDLRPLVGSLRSLGSARRSEHSPAVCRLHEHQVVGVETIR